MKIAIFDLDGTISDGISGADLSIELEKKGILKPGFMAAHQKIADDFINKRIGYNDIYQPWVDALRLSYSDVEFTPVYKYAKEEFVPKRFIYDWVEPLFTELHKRDFLISIVSATLDFYIEILQDDLDFDTFYGTSLEVKEGKFTGEITNHITSQAKANYIKQINKGNDVLIVGDSKGDEDMLALADKGFYLLHKNKGNIEDKPNFSNVVEATHENIADLVLSAF